MPAKLNLSTIVDKFCRRRVFFPLEKLLKPSRLLNTADFRLLKTGNVFTEGLTDVMRMSKEEREGKERRQIWS